MKNAIFEQRKNRANSFTILGQNDRQHESHVGLNNGARMPRLGLGTWKIPVEGTKEAVIAAVEAGYRLIDTANDYGNEHMIGEALQELFRRGVVKREDLFIQAKLWNANHRWAYTIFPNLCNKKQ